MKQRHFEKEQYINMLAKDKEEMKVRGAALWWCDVCGVMLTRVCLCAV